MRREKLKSARKAMGLTQKELGDRVGASADSVSLWECGSKFVKYSLDR
jgi:transcriptional regulator with XRE-family HTH domain